MNAFIIVHLDLTTGHRTELPERFATQLEAAVRVAELTLSRPKQVHLVKFVPTASDPKSDAKQTGGPGA